MKDFIIIFFFLLLFSCGNKSDDSRKVQLGEFELTIDTMKVDFTSYISPNTEMSLTHAVKFDEKYYCFFDDEWSNGNRTDIKHFFILTKTGYIQKEIELPSPIQNCTYFDLFEYKDTIFAKLYMKDNGYYLDTLNEQWVETKKVDDVIYEDDRFCVTYLDYGEWGYATWFIDKETEKEFELASSAKIINKIDSSYYLTEGTWIMKIENPTLLQECKDDYYYEKIEKKDFVEKTFSLIGTEFIYNDTTYSYWNFEEPKVYIATSFTYNNNLFHLCIDSAKTFIANVQNNEIIPLYTIGRKFSTFNCFFSYRYRIHENNKQLLKFKTKSTNLYGFIEIEENKINIRYIKIKKIQ